MSLSSALSNAISGLTAAQTRAATVSNNIANANTAGYVRRTNELAEVVVDGVGQGVRVIATERQTAPELTALRMGASADYQYSENISGTAEILSRLIGEPGAESGLFGAYTAFENALRDAAASPESEILLEQVVTSANRIVDEFRSLNQEAVDLRSTADQDIATQVARTNDALQRLAEINQIGRAALTPNVLDEQQRLIDQVNDSIPVSVYDDNGVVRLYTESGVSLLSSASAETIEFSPSGLASGDRTLENGGLSGLTVNGTDITPTGDSGQRISGGRLSALFETRDEQIPEFMAGLDALATDLVARYADDNVDPTKTAGAEGLFVTGLSSPPADGTVGVASLISVNAAIDKGQGGDATLLRDGLGAATPGVEGNAEQLDRLVEAFNDPRMAPGAIATSGSQSAAKLAASFTSTVNYDYQQRSEDALYAGTRYDATLQSELSATSVDTDQELQELLMIEQAYAANAQVVQVISQLMDLLIDIA